MKVLVTGTSGSGKSAVGEELQEHGFDVVHTDRDVFNNVSIAYWVNRATGEGVNMPWPPPENWHNDNDWVWRVDVLGERLDSGDSSIVFACGDSRNKESAYSLFDKVFVLSADDDILRERVQSRTNNYFGKLDEELAWILDQNKTIADEVSRVGGIVIDAGQPLDKVTKDILAQV